MSTNPNLWGETLAKAHLKQTAVTKIHKNTFNESTAINGFSWIQISKYKWEIVLWFIVVILFVCLTVRNVVYLTIEYIEQEPVTETFLDRTELIGGTLSPGRFDLCFRAILPTFQAELRLPDASPFPFPYNKSLETEVQEALERLNSSKVVMKRGWDYVLVSLMTRYLSAIYYCEQGCRKCDCTNENTLDWWTWAMDAKPDNNSIIVGQQITKMLNHFGSLLGVSGQSLLKAFGAQISGLFSMFGIVGGRFADFEIKFVQQINDMNENGGVYAFCFESIDEVEFSGNSNFVRVSLDGFYKLVRTYGVFGENFTDEDVIEWLKIRTDWEMKLFVNTNAVPNAPDAWSRGGQYNSYNIKISAEYHSIEGCSDNVTARKCTYGCKAEKIQQICGCWPVYWQEASDQNATQCSLEDHKTCNTGTPLQECTTSQICPVHCDQIFYDFINTDKSTQKVPSSISIQLAVPENTYPIFTQVYPTSFMSYLAELGGSLELFLGLSIAGIIHVVVWLGKQFCHCVSGKKSKVGQESEGDFVTKEEMAVLLNRIEQLEKKDPNENGFRHPQDVSNVVIEG